MPLFSRSILLTLKKNCSLEGNRVESFRTGDKVGKGGRRNIQEIQDPIVNIILN